MSALTDRLMQAIDNGETVASVTIVQSEAVPTERWGLQMIVPETGEATGSTGDDALDALAAAEARRVMANGKSSQQIVSGRDGRVSRLYIELYESPSWLVVVGAGHVAKPTAALGKMIGFRVTVLDDRPEFANYERFPEADEVIADDFRLLLQKLAPTFHRQTYVVLVTRGHRQDEMALREVINSKAGYIGMIGSRRRSRFVLEEMLKDGYERERVAAVHAPIGIDIRAETPEEIAVSIISEIISVRRGGTARTLSGRSVLPRQQEATRGS